MIWDIAEAIQDKESELRLNMNISDVFFRCGKHQFVLLSLNLLREVRNGLRLKVEVMKWIREFSNCNTSILLVAVAVLHQMVYQLFLQIFPG